MKNKEIFEQAVSSAKSDVSVEERRQRVLEKYRDMFRLDNIQNLDIEKFRSFFNFSENEHWNGLARNVAQLVADPTKLEQALALLLDESKPVQERIDKVTGQTGTPIVKGFGRARISAILQVAYPDRYGVFNRISMEGLSYIGMNPADSLSNWKSLTLGEQYTEVNNVLVHLSKEYELTLWAMDWAWWKVINGNEPDEGDISEEGQSAPNDQNGGQKPDGSKFALEKHLEDFLVENWDNTILSKDFGLEILEDEETGEVIGEQYKTDSRNRIDLLCKNKVNGGYTIIEIKRNKTTEAVVGQIQKYMGWVSRNLANGSPVDGIIICRDADDDLKDALYVTKNIQYFLYQVSFHLNKGDLWI